MSIESEGPFVAMAVLCHRLDRRPDGTVDVSGIVDGLAITSSPEAPLADHPADLHLTAIVAIRAGSIRGRHTLALRGRFPSGQPGSVVSRPVVLSDEAPGASLNVPLELQLSETGTYWFDVLFDAELLTRISLLVEERPE